MRLTCWALKRLEDFRFADRLRLRQQSSVNSVVAFDACISRVSFVCKKQRRLLCEAGSQMWLAGSLRYDSQPIK